MRELNKCQMGAESISLKVRSRYLTDENTWWPIKDLPIDWDSLKGKLFFATERYCTPHK